MMVKHSIHQKTKYVDEFDLPNLVCTGFHPVISRRENCHKHGQHMCRGKGKGSQAARRVCVRERENSSLCLDYMCLTYSS